MMTFAFFAIRDAMGRRFEAHRRWAMRLFLASSGVWFFRVGLMLWLLINRGPVGIGKNFDGPFVTTWFFGQYLVPLAVLEIYFFVKRNAGWSLKNYSGNNDGLPRGGADAPSGNSPTREGGVRDG
jgi:hypothetical protein